MGALNNHKVCAQEANLERILPNQFMWQERKVRPSGWGPCPGQHCQLGVRFPSSVLISLQTSPRSIPHMWLGLTLTHHLPKQSTLSGAQGHLVSYLFQRKPKLFCPLLPILLPSLLKTLNVSSQVFCLRLRNVPGLPTSACYNLGVSLQWGNILGVWERC